MSDRDFYWKGNLVAGSGNAVKALISGGADNGKGNWVGANGVQMLGYPGDGGGNDRARYEASVIVPNTYADTVPGPPITWSRGAVVDAAYAALYPTHCPVAGIMILGGVVDVHGAYSQAGANVAMSYDALAGIIINLYDTAGFVAYMWITPTIVATVNAYGQNKFFGLGGTNGGAGHTIKLMQTGGVPATTSTGTTNVMATESVDASTVTAIRNAQYAADQDLVEAGKGNLRAGVTLLGIMGTMPAPDANPGTPRRGSDCKCYRNAGTYEAPSWVEMNLIVDLSVASERSEYDGTTRASGDFFSSEAGRVKLPLQFNMPWLPGNGSFDAIFDAYFSVDPADNHIELLVLDGPVSVPGSTGRRATFTFTKFEETQPKDGLTMVSVQAAPWAEAENAPETYTVP